MDLQEGRSGTGGEGSASGAQEPETPSTPANRRIRVFVSSTFRDMIEDRNALMTHTWPELRRFCQERQVELVEVDLRWGVSEAQSTRKETLKLCLDEIRACRPFFVGLLGERYGWVPGHEAFTADLEEEQPWVAGLKGKSVTELEILHGVLNNPEMAERAFFYFRDRAYAEGRGADYVSEDAASAEKQDALKSLIRTTCRAKGIPLREDYSNPRDLAGLVLDDLKAAIGAQFTVENIPDALTREARDHEAFAEMRRRTYIGRSTYFEEMDRHAAGDGGPLAVVGDSGGGKSSLLANWLWRWRVEHPEDFVVQHYIGSTPDSADHFRLMTRLIGEIKRWTGDPEEPPTSHDDILKTFPVWLAKARIKAQREGVRCILVLDALNQLEDIEHALMLDWLPPHPFSGPLRLVVSSLPGNTLDAVTERRWAMLRVDPLTVDERERMIGDYLGRFGKKIDAVRCARLATAPAAANPLYVKILLDELRVTGTHDRLDESLNDYLSAPDIPALLRKVLARYQRDYERDRPGLVGDALSLIWAARRGLTEAELLRLLRGADQPQLPLAIWSPLRAALEEGVLDRAGVLNFAHDFLRSAVETAFVPDGSRAMPLRLRLADDFEAQPVSARTSDELPWLLWKMEAHQRLRSCLLDIERFLEIQRRDQEELMLYWVWLGEERGMGKAYLAAFETWAAEGGRDEARIASVGSALALFLDAAGLYGEAEPLFQRALAIREKVFGPEHDSVAASLDNLAALYQYKGQYAQAEPFHQRALAIYMKLVGPDHPDTAFSLNNLAALYRKQGQYGQAEPLMRRALEIREKTLGADHRDVATCLNNLAELHWAQGRYAQAEPLYTRALAMFEKTLGPEHPAVATSLNNLAALYTDAGQYEQAERLLERAIALREKLLGPDHPDVGVVLNALAMLYFAQGLYERAEPLLQRMLKNFEKAFGPDHPNVAISLNNLGAVYFDQDQYAQAEPLFKRALDIYGKALNPEHPLVAASLTTLGRLYDLWDQYDQAEPLLQRAVAIFEKAVDPHHPDAAQALNNLATHYHDRGRYEQAEPFFRRALSSFEKTLGVEHFSTLNCLINLASTVRDQGRQSESVELYRRALAAYEQLRVQGKPCKSSQLTNEAVCHNEIAYYADVPAGNWAEAERHYRAAMELFEKTGAVGNADNVRLNLQRVLLFSGQPVDTAAIQAATERLDAAGDKRAEKGRQLLADIEGATGSGKTGGE